jgi:signal peptidase II
MGSQKYLRLAFILFILISCVSCDQLTKAVVRKTIQYEEEITVIRDYVTLTKVENKGAFLSAGNSLPVPVKTVLLSIFPLAALIYGLFFLFTKENLTRPMTIGLCFFIGGGIGNIYDRIVNGSVTDFLHIDFGLFQTGIFNVADVSIMAGMFIILISTFFGEKSFGEVNAQ